MSHSHSPEELANAGMTAVRLAQEISDNLAILLTLIDAQARMLEDGVKRGVSADTLVAAVIRDLKLIYRRDLVALTEKSGVASAVYTDEELANAKAKADDMVIDTIMERIFGKN